MKTYFVAKNFLTGFMGQFTENEIMDKLKTGEIKIDYVAVECFETGNTDIMSVSDVKWTPVKDLFKISGPIKTTANNHQTSSLFISKNVKQTISIKPGFTNDLLPNWILGIGWVYFSLSLIGGIILWASSSESHYVSGGLYSTGYTETSVNWTLRAFGIAGMIASLLILLICCGLARVIKQNIYIINKLTEK